MGRLKVEGGGGGGGGRGGGRGGRRGGEGGKRKAKKVYRYHFVLHKRVLHFLLSPLFI